MDNITVSLSTAKRLKEAGFPQTDTKLMWQLRTEDDDYATLTHESSEEYYNEHYCLIPAPTAEEVLRELPQYINGCELRVSHKEKITYMDKRMWLASYYDYSVWNEKEDKCFVKFASSSLSEALAEMYIFLYKKNLL